MSERTHVGLIGCGNWGKLILRDLLALNCQVTVVARSAATRARAAADGAHRVVEDPDALTGIDGAVVATPTTAHAAVIEPLLRRGIRVFSEKPLAASLDEAERLVELGGDRLFVMEKWRYHPGVEALAAIARSGELGAVVGVQTTRVGWATRELDVDATWHLMPHDLSIAVEILGHVPTPRAAVSYGERDRSDGMIATLGSDPWCVIEVSERRRKHFREVRLHCRDGSAILPDSYSESIIVHRGTGRFEPEPPPAELRPISTEMPLLRELRAFVEYLQGGPAPRSSASEAVASVRAVAELRDLAGLPAGSAVGLPA